MNIEYISCALGDTTLTNEQLFERVHQHSTNIPLEGIRDLLYRSGGEERRVRSHCGKGQTPLDYLARAWEPMKRYAPEIGVVICCQIIKGVIEGSQGGIYAHFLGIENAQCFDISEACHGTARSLEVAYGLYRAGLNTKKTLIIGCEFWDGPESPSFGSWSVNNPTDLPTLFAGLTMAQHASLMLLAPSKVDTWSMAFSADNSVALQCQIPLPNWRDHVPTTEYHRAPHTIGNWEFNSNMRDLGYRVGMCVQNVIRATGAAKSIIEEDDCVFCHSHSRTFFFKKLVEWPGLADKIYHVYPLIGNCGSSTLIVGLFLRYGHQIPPGVHLTYIGAAGGVGGSLIRWTQQPQENTAVPSGIINHLQWAPQARGHFRSLPKAMIPIVAKQLGLPLPSPVDLAWPASEHATSSKPETSTPTTTSTTSSSSSSPTAPPPHPLPSQVTTVTTSLPSAIPAEKFIEQKPLSEVITPPLKFGAPN